MRPVETIPGIGGKRRIKENDGVGKFKYDKIHIVSEIL
jgi:hypothetical protein